MNQGANRVEGTEQRHSGFDSCHQLGPHIVFQHGRVGCKHWQHKNAWLAQKVRTPAEELRPFKRWQAGVHTGGAPRRATRGRVVGGKVDPPRCGRRRGGSFGDKGRGLSEVCVRRPAPRPRAASLSANAFPFAIGMNVSTFVWACVQEIDTSLFFCTLSRKALIQAMICSLATGLMERGVSSLI